MATRDEETDGAAAEEIGDADEGVAKEVEDADDHLAEIEDGAGCAEIWEHLSRERGDDD